MNLGQVVHEVERSVAGRTAVLGCPRADGQPMAPADILAVLATLGVEVPA
jgi:hypothetical protein